MPLSFREIQESCHESVIGVYQVSNDVDVSQRKILQIVVECWVTIYLSLVSRLH